MNKNDIFLMNLQDDTWYVNECHHKIIFEFRVGSNCIGDYMRSQLLKGEVIIINPLRSTIKYNEPY